MRFRSWTRQILSFKIWSIAWRMKIKIWRISWVGKLAAQFFMRTLQLQWRVDRSLTLLQYLWVNLTEKSILWARNKLEFSLCISKNTDLALISTVSFKIPNFKWPKEDLWVENTSKTCHGMGRPGPSKALYPSVIKSDSQSLNCNGLGEASISQWPKADPTLGSTFWPSPKTSDLFNLAWNIGLWVTVLESLKSVLWMKRVSP